MHVTDCVEKGRTYMPEFNMFIPYEILGGHTPSHLLSHSANKFTKLLDDHDKHSQQDEVPLFASKLIETFIGECKGTLAVY